jgi:hypothetical protein
MCRSDTATLIADGVARPVAVAIQRGLTPPIGLTAKTNSSAQRRLLPRPHRDRAERRQRERYLVCQRQIAVIGHVVACLYGEPVVVRRIAGSGRDAQLLAREHQKLLAGQASLPRANQVAEIH